MTKQMLCFSFACRGNLVPESSIVAKFYNPIKWWYFAEMAWNCNLNLICKWKDDIGIQYSLELLLCRYQEKNKHQTSNPGNSCRDHLPVCCFAGMLKKLNHISSFPGDQTVFLVDRIIQNNVSMTAWFTRLVSEEKNIKVPGTRLQ